MVSRDSSTMRLAVDLHRARLSGFRRSPSQVGHGLSREELQVVLPHRLGLRCVLKLRISLLTIPPTPCVQRPPVAPLDGELLALRTRRARRPARACDSLRHGRVEVDARTPCASCSTNSAVQPSPRVHPAGPGLDRALADGARRVRDDEVRVHLRLRAQAVAVRAHAQRVVEARSAPGVSSPKREPAVVAGVQLAHHAVGRLGAGLVGDDEDALALAQRRLHRVGEPRPACRGLSTSRSTTSSMSCLDFLSSVDALLEPADLAVDARAGEARASARPPALLVLALAVLDQRREQHAACVPAGSLQDLVDDLLGALLADLAAAVLAVLHADGGVEHAQVVVDLGDRAHRGARVVAGRLLLDGDGGREPAERVVLRLLHLPEELPGVRGEATRRSGAGPRRRGCRRRASSCPSPRPR